VVDLQHRVRTFLVRRLSHLAESKLVVAVSGGVDSMALLHLLHSALPRPALSIVVAHFNHQLRGRESDKDQHLVQRSARSLDLAFRTGSPKNAYQSGTGSIEMWARRERHSFFATTARSLDASFIVTAHHEDDLVESVFLRLFRGEAASLGGMSQYEPTPFDCGLTLLRPLLTVSKSTLVDFAKTRRIEYRNDLSNWDESFKRNWIRNRLMPQIVECFGPSVTTTVQRCAEILGAESDYLEGEATAWLATPEPQRAQQFSALPTALQRRLVLKQIKEASLVPDFAHIEQLRNQLGRAVMLEGGVSVRLDQTGRLVRVIPQLPLTFDRRKIGVSLKKDTTVQFGPVTLRWRIHSLRQPFGLPSSKTGRELLDADEIGREIILRHWQPGDRFQPIGLPKPAKIQNLFVSARIPAEIRRSRIVAARPDGEIFWVEGLRISEKFKLSFSTRRYLDWRWQRAEPLLATPMGA
jgi:tRNA(Ile)-lysidine synthase